LLCFRWQRRFEPWSFRNVGHRHREMVFTTIMTSPICCLTATVFASCGLSASTTPRSGPTGTLHLGALPALPRGERRGHGGGTNRLRPILVLLAGVDLTTDGEGRIRGSIRHWGDREAAARERTTPNDEEVAADAQWQGTKIRTAASGTCKFIVVPRRGGEARR
jgi:hypothetical protein